MGFNSAFKGLTVRYLCQWRRCVLYCGSDFAWF